MKPDVETIGHSLYILPGDSYSLGKDDGTFAINWGGMHITCYKIVEETSYMSYELREIPQEECSADLQAFRHFFAYQEIDNDFVQDGSSY